jgi:3-methyladenine DNA glycosylase AlkC
LSTPTAERAFRVWPDRGFRIPGAPNSIEKGASLGDLLAGPAIDCLAHNISRVHPTFAAGSFRRAARAGLGPLGLLQRGRHLAHALRQYLPSDYAEAVGVLLRSLTPPLETTEDNGLAVFFYLPHVTFVGLYGLDDFETSMRAQYELTKRFSAEFSLRPFLIRQPERTLARLSEWTRDPDPHVRRLCSEGTRPRLPWAPRLPAFIEDPRPVLPLLTALRDDPSLYVRRSVANHLGDIAKDHPELVFKLCAHWLRGASAERKWLLRHALRHPARKGDPTALRLRQLAG